MYQPAMHILIFEDNAYDRKALEEIIYREHLQKFSKDDLVLSTGSFDRAMDYVKTTSAYTVYLLDILINNKMLGYDLAKHIRKHNSKAPIIFITGHADAFVNQMEYKLLANSFIFKDSPLLADELTDALEYFRMQIKTDGALEIKSRFHQIFVDYDSIYYIETIPGALKAKVVCRNKIYETNGTLTQILQNLSSHFLRVSKFRIVNLDKVIEINRSKHIVKLMDLYEIPYSTSYLKGGLLYADNNH